MEGKAESFEAAAILFTEDVPPSIDSNLWNAVRADPGLPGASEPSNRPAAPPPRSAAEASELWGDLERGGG